MTKRFPSSSNYDYSVQSQFSWRVLNLCKNHTLLHVPEILLGITPAIGSRPPAYHPSLEIPITLGCLRRKNRPNSMNLWQKPMSSYKTNFFLGVCPFL